MNQYLAILALLILNISLAQGQSKPYVNHTELGPLVGDLNKEHKRVNFSIQSFNGVKLNQFHEIGFLAGLDTYPGFTLMPLAMGWRGILEKGRDISPYASMDFGYGSAWIQKRRIQDLMESWHQGGLYFSPALGLRKKARKSDLAFTWSVGYKLQHASFYEGWRVPGMTSGIGEKKLPPGFSSIREESYKFNSLYLKLGVVF